VLIRCIELLRHWAEARWNRRPHLGAFGQEDPVVDLPNPSLDRISRRKDETGVPSVSKFGNAQQAIVGIGRTLKVAIAPTTSKTFHYYPNLLCINEGIDNNPMYDDEMTLL
jgi:hypothetical protein